MPGGQFTNLKEQARSLGLQSRWHEVAKTYSDVNAMLGDIVKVTPSSKCVGDMALMMVSQDLTVADVENPDVEVAFPESVVSLLRNELSRPHDGWPEVVQAKALKGEAPIEGRFGAELPAVDLDAAKTELGETLEREISDRELASWLMYPKVFTDFDAAMDQYGPTSTLPTPVYFYGLDAGEEIFIEIEKGKTLVVRCLAVGEPNDKGMVRVFFELNGQPRSVTVPDRAHGASGKAARPKAENGNPDQIGAPLPGVISALNVSAGQQVSAGDVLLAIEAMKMETMIHAERSGTIEEVLAGIGDQIDARELLIRFTADPA